MRCYSLLHRGYLLQSRGSGLWSLQEVRVTTNCGNGNTLFSIKEQKRVERRGEKAGVLLGLWGWARARLEPAKIPTGLQKSMVYSMQHKHPLNSNDRCYGAGYLSTFRPAPPARPTNLQFCSFVQPS